MMPADNNIALQALARRLRRPVASLADVTAESAICVVPTDPVANCVDPTDPVANLAEVTAESAIIAEAMVLFGIGAKAGDAEALVAEKK